MANKVAVFAFPGKPAIVAVALLFVLLQTSINLEAQTWISNNAPTLSWLSVGGTGCLVAIDCPSPGCS